MTRDIWGFPVVDWTLVPKAKRGLVSEFKPADVVDFAYVGIPAVTAYGTTTGGKAFLVGPGGVLYSYKDFELAAKMPIDEYMTYVGFAMSDAQARMTALVYHKLRHFKVTYAPKTNPFAFKSQLIFAADQWAAESYSNDRIATAGNVLISVEAKSNASK